MKRFLMVWIIIMAPSWLMAYTPLLWSHTYGGSNDDNITDVQQTNDGGYILIGYAKSFGAGLYDFWLVKTDANGDSLWSRTFGGSNNDIGNVVQQTPDGGYFLAGRSDSYGAGSGDFWLIRTDANGDSLWSRTYGGSEFESALTGQLTSDGGFIMAGYTRSFGSGMEDFWVVKTNADGDSLWSRSLGGNRHELCCRIQQAADDSYLLTGYTESYGAGSLDGWLVRVSAAGDSLWSHTYGTSQFESCNGSLITSDNGYILVGSQGPHKDNCDFWVVKTDSNGDILWSRTYGGGYGECANSVLPTSDDGYFIGGWTCSYGAGSRDSWLLRINSSGDSLWNRTFGGSLNEWGANIRPTNDPGFIVTISTESFGAGNHDYWLQRFGADMLGSAHVSLISSGPPNWHYRLDHAQGSINQLIFTDFCPGTVGSVSGDAAAAGWTVESSSGQIIFTTANPLTAGSIGTFTLTHPFCSDIVTWQAGDSSGYVDGPLPVELLSFKAEPVNNGIQLEFSTASETNNDHFEIWKSQTESDDFVLLTQLESQGQSAMEQHYSYLDRDVANGQTYWYYLADVDLSGNRTEHRERIVSARAEVSHALPVEFSITNYPNPFNPETTIYYKIAESTPVTISIHNALGQLITILTAKEHSAGTYEIIWNAASLPSGIYLCRMQTSQIQKMIKLVMIK